MKSNLELNYYGLSTMTDDEALTIDGGVFGLDDLVVGIVAGLVISAVDHWSDIKKGASDAVSSW